tara:strand:- start:218 stop:739 length:522 start_codon:yes stop_codon:yes gene_type:complete
MTNIKEMEKEIDSLKAKLKQEKGKRPYGSAKGVWLNSMRIATSPFATYHKSIQGYLQDPELHEFAKLIRKTQDFCLKIQKKKDAFSSSKVLKTIEKLVIIENKVLNHSVYINEKYKESMNVKETLEEVNNLKDRLREREEKFKICMSTEQGVTEEQQAKKLLELIQAELPNSE